MSNFWKNKNVIVTGAGGFVGQKLCQRLYDLGSNVTAVVRSIDKFPLQSPRIKIFEIDLCKDNNIFWGNQNNSYVFHLAALDGGSGYKNEHKEEIYKKNITITKNLLYSLESVRIAKFIYISSAEVYLKLKIRNKVKENDLKKFSWVKPDHGYAYSKFCCEKLVQSFGKKWEVPVLIIRPGNIYGPGDSPKRKRLIPYLLERIKNGEQKIILKGNGQNIRSFLYIEDYIENLLSLTEHARDGIFNLSGENPISIKDFVGIIAQQSGRKIEFEDKFDPSKKDIFLLDNRKARKLINWQDSTYEKRIKEMLK